MCELAIARVQFGRRSAGELIAHLQARKVAGSTKRSERSELELMAWAIAAAARRVPWRADCLVQALAAARWLAGKGHHGEFFVGVGAPTASGLPAHAWLHCDGVAITGGDGAGFTTLVAPGLSTHR
jgi:hypothetical protein